MTDHEQTFKTPSDDPDMDRAKMRARSTFKYFWRELSWEYRRIVPGLDLSAVKMPFIVPDPGPQDPSVEQMWATEIQFDGDLIKGSLLNQPTWVPDLQPEDEVSCPFSSLEDWLYSIGDEAFGGYTVNVMRMRMEPPEREQHDAAWGLTFTDSGRELIFPQQSTTAAQSFNGPGAASDPEVLGREDHPMCLNMRERMEQALAEEPGIVNQPDDEGWTMLQREALAGNLASCQALLNHGADKLARTPNGYTPLDLALKLGWDFVAQVLK